MMPVRRSFVLAALAIAVAGCIDQPTAVRPAEPELLDWAAAPLFSADGNSATVSETGPGTIYLGPRDNVNLEQTRVSFWAVRGQSRSVQINYKTRRHEEPRPFLLLTTTDPQFVPGIGELAMGDSVRITIKVNEKKLLVSLEPTGLQFGAPGQLTIWYDGAGQSNAGDDQYVEIVDDANLALFYREDQKHPWSQLAATQSITNHSFTYAIPHFSDYAVARMREWAIQY
jgi:hypothetical protein